MVEECYPQTSTLYFSESSTVPLETTQLHILVEEFMYSTALHSNLHEQLSQIKMVLKLCLVKRD